MSTRFPIAPKSDTEAINGLADRVNGASIMNFLTQAASLLAPSVAQLINGIYKQTGTPGAYNFTLPTAAAIVAAIPACQVGSFFEFMLMNGGDGTITVVTAAGVTLSGTTAVPTLKSQIYRGVVTNATVGAEAVTFVGILTAAI